RYCTHALSHFGCSRAQCQYRISHGNSIENTLKEVLMKYNFDEVIDRRNTDAVKTDFNQMIFGSEDVLPLWVADMDFRTPDFVLDALKARLEHPVLGYSRAPK